MGQFNDKVVVVTGAARGIGQATALRFARSGANLALCDLDKEWVQETANKVVELGGRAACYSVDISNKETVQKLMQDIHTDFKRIDILINNAGITKDGLIARMSEEDWDQVININLKGTFLCTKAASKYMMKQRSGAIVNVASIIGLIGNAGQCNYSASKAGVIALTKSTAKELARRDVRANAVAPGFIATKMTDELSEDVKQGMLSAIPMERFGTPEDVANVIHYLASDEASYVTGQVLTVCGGMVT
ncbi:MAG: 3-oxoacyl-[acyl-carrier-protein] reductase [Kiritimatiellae bacterium]|nr:3-oxoacyl-[acyl-carrier-protein] reductase [Kiritimatiellia bacterium]